MQVAAHEARLGHGKLATDLRDIIDQAKKRRGAGSTVPISQPRGELATLLEASYPKSRLGDMILGVSSDNQDENVATIKMRTRGRDATSARTMAVAGERGGRVSGMAGMRRPAARTQGSFHGPGAASVASRDGAVEGGFSEG